MQSHRVSGAWERPVPEEAHAGRRIRTGTGANASRVPVAGVPPRSDDARQAAGTRPAGRSDVESVEGRPRTGRAERQAAHRPVDVGRNPAELIKCRRGLQPAGGQLGGHLGETLVVGPDLFARLDRATGREGVEVDLLTQSQ